MWILITGANGGIGQALCENFSKNGYSVFATDQQPKADCQNNFYFSMDLFDYVNNLKTQKTFLETVRAQINNEGLGGLINNAAVQILKKTTELAQSDWQRTLDINLTAPFLLSRALFPELIKGKGNILNISSVHQSQTKPEFAAYSTSKTALSGLTRALAIDFDGQVRVNCIAPAAIETEMLKAGFEGKKDSFERLNQYHPSGRIGKPSEVAEFAYFVMHGNNHFINGANLTIDGGISGRLHDPE